MNKSSIKLSFKKCIIRSISVLPILILTLILFSCNEEESANDIKWNGVTITVPADFNDTTRTFTIRRSSDLAWVAAMTNNNPEYDGFDGYTIILATDLDLGGVYDGSNWESSGAKWIPIGTSKNHRYFKGIFDGKGHAIRNLYVNSERLRELGLFGYSAGVIKNLTIKSGCVTYPDSVGTRYAGGVCGYATGSIDSVTNKCTLELKDARIYAGGICGYSLYTISNSENYGNVYTRCLYNSSSTFENRTDMGRVFSGGICGYSGGNINLCKNHAEVIISEVIFAYAGGICGYSQGSVRDCEQDGNITVRMYSHSSYAGGICGYALTLTDCVNRGTIQAESEAETHMGDLNGNNNL